MCFWGSILDWIGNNGWSNTRWSNTRVVLFFKCIIKISPLYFIRNSYLSFTRAISF